jgi:hypothetical protein
VRASQRAFVRACVHLFTWTETMRSSPMEVSKIERHITVRACG